MSCLLALLGLCFFDPSTVTLTATSEWDVSQTVDKRCFGQPCDGPLATISIGAGMTLSDTLTLRYAVAHRSFLVDSHDRGEEFVSLSVEWRPLK